MAATEHTHDELATKRDVDARFDRIERRLDEIEAALTKSGENHTENFAQLSNSIVSLLNILITLTGRVNAPEDNQRRIVELLERIEKRVAVE